MSEQISDVETVTLENPLEEPFGYAQGWVTERTATLVRIETDSGTVGWGDCWGPIAGNRELVDDFFAERLVGRDPEDVERIHDDLYQAGRAAFQSFVPLTAISGIDLALWDLKGKLAGKPVSALLGGRQRETVEAYGTGHYFKHEAEIETQYERISSEARANADAFGAIKLKVGTQLIGHGPEQDIELVRRVRDTVDDDTTIMVDANYAYNLPQARRVSEALETLDVHWFEEPLPPENVDAYADLREGTDVRIAAGECHAPYEFDRLFDAGAVDVAQPDVCNVGGLTSARYIARLAADHAVQLIPHVWGTPIAIAASLQLIATLDGQPLLEYDQSPNPLRDSLLAESSLKPDSEGKVPIPDEPGLGIDIQESAVREYATPTASGSSRS